jgi:hypothetical protein
MVQHKYNQPILVLFALLFLLTIPSESIYSQGALKVLVRLIIKKGDTAGSKIVLYRNGQVIEEVPVSSGRFEVNLEYNSDLFCPSKKAGYVTKKIEIDTKFRNPSERY